MPPLDVLETCLYVDDLQLAERFYERVLGLELFDRQPGRHVFFRCGRSMLLLFDPRGSDSESDVPAHGTRGPGHVAFRVADDDLRDWQAHLRACEVPIEKSIDWPQGGRSVYFRDPAGNSLEFASPRIWQLE